MHNLAEQQNASSLPSHHSGEKGDPEDGGGGVDGRETITEPSCEPGNQSGSITFALLMAHFHFHSHILLVSSFLKGEILDPVLRIQKLTTEPPS